MARVMVEKSVDYVRHFFGVCECQGNVTLKPPPTPAEKRAAMNASLLRGLAIMSYYDLGMTLVDLVKAGFKLPL